jgi:hypothetical protein
MLRVKMLQGIHASEKSEPPNTPKTPKLASTSTNNVSFRLKTNEQSKHKTHSSTKITTCIRPRFDGRFGHEPMENEK